MCENARAVFFGTRPCGLQQAGRPVATPPKPPIDEENNSGFTSAPTTPESTTLQ
jgi:hypothetical protein